ncbi:MAG: CBS domain-containing protein [Thermoplasmata archaeon]|nr:CBS domain-containing protein [Thermoplasmata archaeon]
MDEHAYVAEIMTRVVARVEPTASAHEAAVLMRSNHVSGLPVVDPAGRLVGVVSEIDLVRGIHRATGAMSARGFLDILLDSTPRSGAGPLEASQARLKNARVSEFMTSRPVTIDPETTIREASRLLTQHGISRLPVVDSRHHVVGIVTRTDIVQAIEGRTIGPKGSLTPAPAPERPTRSSKARREPPDPYADV